LLVDDNKLIENEKLKKAIEGWLIEYPFELFSTLTFRYDKTPHNTELFCKGWIRDISKREGVQIASLGVISGLVHPHLHLLMLGRSKNNKTLKDINIDYWKNEWSKFSSGADIQRIYYRKGVAPYIAKHFTFIGDYSMLFDYNGKLLNKTRIKKNIPMAFGDDYKYRAFPFISVLEEVA
jgi:hypothetical protein